jgi:hypothetical protein
LQIPEAVSIRTFVRITFRSSESTKALRVSGESTQDSFVVPTVAAAFPIRLLSVSFADTISIARPGTVAKLRR